MPLERIKSHFAVAMDDKNETAEIKMYGNVVKKRPVDWWTGKPADGDFIVGSEVINKLDEIRSCKRLNIRLNSLGGDVHGQYLSITGSVNWRKTVPKYTAWWTALPCPPVQ